MKTKNHKVKINDLSKLGSVLSISYGLNEIDKERAKQAVKQHQNNVPSSMVEGT